MSERFRIAVIDDHPLVRSGVIRTLEKQPEFAVIGEGASCDDAVRIAQEELPDLILLDVSMPGGGVNAARTIAATCPVVKIVMLTVSEDEATVTSALEAGARGYILKGVSGPDFIKTLRAIAQGEAYVSPALAARLLAGGKAPRSAKKDAKSGLLSLLTARELTILQHLAQGKSNREIGDAVGLTERTVKHYMHNILQKLQVQNRVAAALFAEREFARGN